MFDQKLDSTADLAWMLQNSQVSDTVLVEALAQRNYASLYHLAFTALGHALHADRVVQAAIHTAVRNRHRYSGEISLKAWLFRIAYRRTHSYLPSLGLSRYLAPAVGAPAAPAPAEPPELIGPILARLKGKEYLAALLHFVHGLPAAEVAWVLGWRLRRVHTFLTEIRTAPAQLSTAVSGEALSALSEAERLDLGPEFIHEEARQLVQEDLDGLLSRPGRQADAERLQEHLQVCGYCQDYAARISGLERQLAQAFQAYDSPLELTEPELEEISGFLAQAARPRTRSRRLGLSLREISFGALVVAIVIGVTWYNGLLQTLTGWANLAPPPMAAPATAISPTLVVAQTQPLESAPLPTLTPTPTQPAIARTGPSGSNPEIQSQDVTLSFDRVAQQMENALPDEYQGWNHSGVANLSLVMLYWDWRGYVDHLITTLQPNPSDENVMPYEMITYIEERTDFQSYLRMGGEISTLTAFLDHGIPILVERGVFLPEVGWIAHYDVVVGYNAHNQRLQLLDFDSGAAETFTIHYNDFNLGWRAFNYTYLVVFPAGQQNQVNTVLGRQSDEAANLEDAARRASNEIYTLGGVDHFFAWFNRGTSLAYLDDYYGAAAAYDEAFAVLDTLPEEDRPARMLRFQTRPYWAYFYTGRYQDVIDLATATLSQSENSVLEESYYWRGLAREALGDLEGAIADLNTSVEINPNFVSGIYQLRRLQGGT